MWPKDLATCFSSELILVHKLLEQVGSQKGVSPGVGKKRGDTVSVCYLVVGLRRGRCHQCQQSKKMPP